MTIQTKTTVTLMAVAIVTTAMILCANMTISDLIAAL